MKNAVGLKIDWFKRGSSYELVIYAGNEERAGQVEKALKEDISRIESSKRFLEIESKSESAVERMKGD